MKTRDYFLIWLAALALLFVVGLLQSAPGYMDAEYYFGMGLRIAKDNTLTEPFLWNYLHDQRVLPHPGFTYWQPLPAFIAAAGMILSGLENFLGARLGFMLISSCVPLISILLGWELTKKRKIGILAGLFSLFPVFYSPFLGTTDAFGVMIVLGGIFLISINKFSDQRFIFLGGLSAGLIHLTRSDGLIWFGIGLIFCFIDRENLLQKVLIFMLGYLVVMAPWFGRNLMVLDEVLPSGASRMFWLEEYNDLFLLIPAELNFEAWRSQGYLTIFNHAVIAVGANLKTAIFVHGQLILAPLAAIGLWESRKERITLAGGMIYGLLFILMSFVFPFAGWRGGLFHAGAGLQSLFWVLSATGFINFIDLGVQKRDWKEQKALLMFGSGLVVVLAAATGYIFWSRVIGGDINNPAWEQSQRDALIVAAELDKLGVAEQELIMINNPPGFFAAAGRSSIVIPNGPVEDLIRASKEFGVHYLVLEPNHADQLNELYQDPGGDHDLIWIHSHNGAQYFAFPGETH